MLFVHQLISLMNQASSHHVINDIIGISQRLQHDREQRKSWIMEPTFSNISRGLNTLDLCRAIRISTSVNSLIFLNLVLESW